MIVVVDTGGANLASLLNALERLGKKALLTVDPDLIAKAEKVFLPGVGAAQHAMDRLLKLELVESLKKLKNPVLGLCLGMQLLFTSSEEGDTTCLGIFPDSVTRFPKRDGFPVPHMGWNRVSSTEDKTPLLKGIPDGNYFYFVHSYRAPDSPWVRGITEYGETFPSIVERENVFGVQFHPERSADAGEKLLQNFLSL